MRKHILYFVVCAVLLSSMQSASANIPGKPNLATETTTATEIGDVALSDMPIPTAASFTVIFKTPIDTRIARNGDKFQAELKEDLQIEDQIVATAGSLLVGHLEESTVKRPLYRGGRAGESRLSIGNRKAVRSLFDQIVTDGREINIVGVASKQKINIIGEGAMREILVGCDGELEHSDRIMKSGRKIFAAAMPKSVHSDRRPTGADIEEGDELLIQAHSPYEAVKVSSR